MKNNTSGDEPSRPELIKTWETYVVYAFIILIVATFIFWSIFLSIVTGLYMASILTGTFFSFSLFPPFIIFVFFLTWKKSIWQYKYKGKTLRVLHFKRKQVLFNTKDVYNIFGIEKRFEEPTGLDLATMVELANSHDAAIAGWLRTDFIRLHINDHTATNLKLDDDWKKI